MICSLVRYKVRLAAFHIELRVGGRQHFYSWLLSPHTELQAHLQRLAVSHQQIKIEIREN